MSQKVRTFALEMLTRLYRIKGVAKAVAFWACIVLLGLAAAVWIGLLVMVLAHGWVQTVPWLAAVYRYDYVLMGVALLMLVAGLMGLTMLKPASSFEPAIRLYEVSKGVYTSGMCLYLIVQERVLSAAKVCVIVPNLHCKVNLARGCAGRNNVIRRQRELCVYRIVVHPIYMMTEIAHHSPPVPSAIARLEVVVLVVADERHDIL